MVTIEMSEFVQKDFTGGINLLLDDTNLTPSQYRLGINLRNRYDSLQVIPSSVEDVSLPAGIVQEMVTFGNYLIAFISGLAYYRFYSNTGWTQIDGFAMSSTASRYWTKAVPVALTNYARVASGAEPVTGHSQPNAAAPIIQINNVAGQTGNNPGLVVQDGVSQPWFIFLDPNGFPDARVTQSYDQWAITFDTNMTTVLSDMREYVPIGTYMEWLQGILFIVRTDGISIYRSVSGRPLDFVVNVQLNGQKGGDANTTSYSVGVGGITCIRAMNTGALFVAAANVICFSVSLNTTPGAPTIFGEYTFIRTFLFNAGCLSDRTIIDALGDTYFIDLPGLRSFNAVLQLQNEGRNSIFTAIIASAFSNIIQDATATAAILFDNYAIFSVNTIFGQALAIYDTINQCWSSFDLNQTGGKAVKQFAVLAIDVLELYAITVDNKFYHLYSSTTANDIPTFRSQSVNSCENYYGTLIKLNSPKTETKLQRVRAILNNIIEDCTISCTPFVDNRLTQSNTITNSIKYSAPATTYNGVAVGLGDINTMLSNQVFQVPNIEQGYKTFFLLTWTGTGNITQLSMEMMDVTPMRALQTESQSS